jgi:hypothetical protein
MTTTSDFVKAFTASDLRNVSIVDDLPWMRSYTLTVDTNP